jgi:hypothetical protein
MISSWLFLKGLCDVDHSSSACFAAVAHAPDLVIPYYWSEALLFHNIARKVRAAWNLTELVGRQPNAYLKFAYKIAVAV